MRRLALLLLLGAAACASGETILPASFRGPVAVAAFQGLNPSRPGTGLVPLIAVAGFRGAELRLIDPATDLPVAARNLAWPLAVPTMPRPSFLASRSLGDGGADLLMVADTGTHLQLVGTWLDGSKGYGVVATWDLSSAAMGSVVAPGAQILSVVAAGIPSGPPTGVPPAAPTVAGRAWIVVGLSDPTDFTAGTLVVLELARQADGSIALAGLPVAKHVFFSPGGLAAAPDNVHLYASSLDPIRDSASANGILGVAEIDVSGGLQATWPVRAFDARGSATTGIMAAFVGERGSANFYTFDAPTLRVYAILDAAGCGAEKRIACGVATFDPATGALATDPASPGPEGWPVPTQTYRTPFIIPSIPLTLGFAMPPANPGDVAPSAPFGSQVCWSPATPGVTLPLCPSVTEISGQPAFNGRGYPQAFMDQAPDIGQLWTSVVGMVTAVDGLAYVMDLGRFGPVNGTSMLGSDTTRTQTTGAVPVVPLGPISNSAIIGPPAGSAVVALWYDQAATPTVVTDTATLNKAQWVWPGFTRDDTWSVSFQGMLPGLSQRRSVFGLTAGGQLYVGIQEAATAVVGGVMPAASYWVPGAIVESPELGIHTTVANGAGDLDLFLLDNDPCLSTRPNWVPSGSTTPVYDPTKFPQPHEAVILDRLPPDPLLYPGGALVLGPADDPAMAQEYQCLVTWLSQPSAAGKVLTAFNNVNTLTDYPRASWIRASGFVLVGASTGYAGRPTLDVRYNFAWSEEDALAGEALSLARKARRFYYPASYPKRSSLNYPGMLDPMEPGPVLSFRLGRYCLTTATDCDPTTSPPARDAGLIFSTVSGLVPMFRHPSGTAGGNWVTSFDKSTIPGLEYKGSVFYVSFTGDAVEMIPPGLDGAQATVIR